MAQRFGFVDATAGGTLAGVWCGVSLTCRAVGFPSDADETPATLVIPAELTSVGRHADVSLRRALCGLGRGGSAGFHDQRQDDKEPST
jgi:hypothetical protein